MEKVDKVWAWILFGLMALIGLANLIWHLKPDVSGTFKEYTLFFDAIALPVLFLMLVFELCHPTMSTSANRE